MKYKIIENYIDNPKKIYDGGEPKHIYFDLKNKRGERIEKIDFWAFWEKSSECIIVDDKVELKEINKILNLPVVNNFIVQNDNVIALDLYNNGMFIPVEFVKCKNNYIISFILDEVSPSRYQCYIIAVLKEEKTEERDCK